jgi:hypothetical protein
MRRGRRFSTPVARDAFQPRPAAKPAGFLLHPPHCVLPHVISLGRDVGTLSPGTSRRAFSLRSWGYEISVQNGLRNSPYIRAGQHGCCECLARDCSAGCNEQLIRGLGRRAAPQVVPLPPTSPRPETWRGFSLEFSCRAAGSADMSDHFRHDLPGSMSRCSLRGREPPLFRLRAFLPRWFYERDH